MDTHLSATPQGLAQKPRKVALRLHAVALGNVRRDGLAGPPHLVSQDIPFQLRKAQRQLVHFQGQAITLLVDLQIPVAWQPIVLSRLASRDSLLASSFPLLESTASV